MKEMDGMNEKIYIFSALKTWVKSIDFQYLLAKVLTLCIEQKKTRVEHLRPR